MPHSCLIQKRNNLCGASGPLSDMKILLYLLFPVLFYLHISCNPYSLPENTSTKETAFTIYLEGLDLYEAGEYEQAMQKVVKAIGMNRNFAQFHQLKGDIYRKYGNSEQALQAYEEALRTRSNFTGAYRSMGEIYFEKRKYQNAIRSYKKILATDANQIDVYLDLASCYLEIGEFQIVKTNLGDYRRLAIENTVTPEDRLDLLYGKVYYKTEDFRKALEHFEAFYQKNADNQEAMFLLGRTHYALENFERGVGFFNKLIRVNAKSGAWYLYRGIYFFQKNDMQDAKGQFDYALKLDDTLHEVHYFLGRIHEIHGEISMALQKYRLYRDNAGTKVEHTDVHDRITRLESL